MPQKVDKLSFGISVAACVAIEKFMVANSFDHQRGLGREADRKAKLLSVFKNSLFFCRIDKVSKII